MLVFKGQVIYMFFVCTCGLLHFAIVLFDNLVKSWTDYGHAYTDPNIPPSSTQRMLHRLHLMFNWETFLRWTLIWHVQRYRQFKTNNYGRTFYAWGDLSGSLRGSKHGLGGVFVEEI